MGLLDSLIGSVLGGGGNQQQNPLLQIAMSLLTSQGSGKGLAGLASQFDQKGLGHLMQSWIGTGENKEITPEQMQHALGSEQVAQMAQQTGMPAGDITSALAKMLPQLINHATPQGQVPPQNDLQGMLTGLLGTLGK